MVSLEIGTGTLVSGAFASIDWSAGPYFIKTDTDPLGGTLYTITGTSQLMSVPYALHAKTKELPAAQAPLILVQLSSLPPAMLQLPMQKTQPFTSAQVELQA